MNPLAVAPPTNFTLGPVTIYYYSLCISLAVMVGYWLLQRRITKTDLSPHLIDSAVIYFLLGSLLGARLGFVVQNSDFFFAQPVEIFRLTSGGLSIHGAVLGAVLLLWVFVVQRKIALFKLTDLFVAPLLLGQIIGRLGNYFNQELYGYPAQLPWKQFIDEAHRLPTYIGSATYHPVFLYEMILNGIGLWLLLRIPLKKEGVATYSYLLIYGIVRFVVEIFRISDRLAFGLSLAQIVSLLVALFALNRLLKLPAYNISQKVQNTLSNVREDRN